MHQKYSLQWLRGVLVVIMQEIWYVFIPTVIKRKGTYWNNCFLILCQLNEHESFVVLGRGSAAIGYKKDFRKSYLCLHSYNSRRACSLHMTLQNRLHTNCCIEFFLFVSCVVIYLSFPKLFDTNKTYLDRISI